MITKYKKYIKENYNWDLERCQFFFDFYYNNFFFNFFDENSLYKFGITINENFISNLVSIFYDKSKAEHNIKNVFYLTDLQRCYLEYYIYAYSLDEYNLQINYKFISKFNDGIHIIDTNNYTINMLFDNMINLSDNKEIEKFFINEITKDVKILSVLEYDLKFFSQDFHNKIKHLSDAKNFDLI